MNFHLILRFVCQVPLKRCLMNRFPHTVSLIIALVMSAVGNRTPAITIDMVPVGNPGNAPDTQLMSDGTTGYGSVGYNYQIGKYEVTVGQYIEFLNAVAKADPNGLYNTNMLQGENIQQTGSSPNFSYSVGDYFGTVAADWVNRPVNLVSFWNAARFANWLHNGQPTGAQGPATTERGAYTLDGYKGQIGRAHV